MSLSMRETLSPKDQTREVSYYISCKDGSVGNPEKKMLKSMAHTHTQVDECSLVQNIIVIRNLSLTWMVNVCILFYLLRFFFLLLLIQKGFHSWYRCSSGIIQYHNVHFVVGWHDSNKYFIELNHVWLCGNVRMKKLNGTGWMLFNSWNWLHQHRHRRNEQIRIMDSIRCEKIDYKSFCTCMKLEPISRLFGNCPHGTLSTLDSRLNTLLYPTPTHM